MAHAIAPAQSANPVFKEEQGYVEVNHEHVPWPAPQSVADELRSSDEHSRLHAFALLGLADQQIHTAVWSQGNPSKFIGEKLVTPDQVQLTYAALGQDPTQQAILAIQIELQETYVAVATPIDGHWERVALSNCWCRYDPDPLHAFIQINPTRRINLGQNDQQSLQGYELILRASGGGSGLYVQDEAHFQVHAGELRRTIGFTSRRRSCYLGAETTSCSIEARWLSPIQLNSGPGAVLAEAKGSFRNPRQMSTSLLEICNSDF
ncbi:MAG TPA: hypothetical protein VNW54_06460 [Granulicella sp.]|nr:hypothetical protein [Granulicella sp.]